MPRGRVARTLTSKKRPKTKGKGVGSWLKGAAKKTSNFLYNNGSKIAKTAAAAAALAAAGYGTYKAAKAGKDAIDYADKKVRQGVSDAGTALYNAPGYAANKAVEGLKYASGERKITEAERKQQSDATKRSLQSYEDPFKWTDYDRDYLPGGELYYPGNRITKDAEEREAQRHQRSYVDPDVQHDVNELGRQRAGVHHQDEFYDAREWGGSLKHCPTNYGGRMTVKRLHHLKHCHKCSTGKGAYVIKALHSMKAH